MIKQLFVLIVNRSLHGLWANPAERGWEGKVTGDKTLVCQDCLQEFAWTVGEQEFYEDKGLEEPKYCLICRGKNEAQEKQLSQYRKSN